MCNSCISVFLAQVIGVFLFLISLGMLVHQQRYKKLMNEFLGNPSLLNFSGGVGILLGLLILGCHNVWVSDWPVLITLTQVRRFPREPVQILHYILHQTTVL